MTDENNFKEVFKKLSEAADREKEQELHESFEKEAEITSDFIIELKKSKKRRIELEEEECNLVDNDYILKCKLPSFAIDNTYNVLRLEKPQNFIITMYRGPGVCKSLLSAAKEHDLECIVHLRTNEIAHTKFIFENARIGGMSFGDLDKSSNGTDIEFEVLFDSLNIDDEEVLGV